MLLHAVCFSICQWSGRAIRLAYAALFLLLAANTESTARTPDPSGHESLLHASTLSSIPVSTEDHADDVQAGGSSRDSLIGNAMFTAITSSHIGTGAAPVAETAADESPLHTAVAENRIPDWERCLD